MDDYKDAYKAIRSGDVSDLRQLIENWLVSDRSAIVEPTLTEAFGDLILKRIPIQNDMELFVISQLVNRRFNNDSTDDVTFQSVYSRIEEICNNIDTILHFENNKIDEKFVYLSKCLAKDINLLKRQIKYTYEFIPWEEMEFIIICFTVVFSAESDLNIYNLSVLNKKKVLQYLTYFNTIMKQLLEKMERMSHPEYIVDIVERLPNSKTAAERCKMGEDIRELHTYMDLEKCPKTLKDLMLKLLNDLNSDEQFNKVMEKYDALKKSLKDFQGLTKYSENDLDDFKRRHFSILCSATKLQRETIISNILNKYSFLSSLYEDYKLLRDVYSLDKIKSVIDIAVEVKCSDKDAPLVLKKTLQVIGENVKNSKESPNMSEATSELILLSALPKTIETMKRLRNSLSHIYTEQTKSEREKETFFLNLQNDLKKIAYVIFEILRAEKLTCFKKFLDDVVNGTNEDVNEMLDAFRHVSLKDIMEAFQSNVVTNEQENIKQLVVKLMDKNITNMTAEEETLLTNIYSIIDMPYFDHSNVLERAVGFEYLFMFFLQTARNNRSADDIQVAKNIAENISYKLSTILNITENDETKLLNMLKQFQNRVKSRVPDEVFKEISSLIKSVFHICYVHNKSTMWIDEFENEVKYKHPKKKVATAPSTSTPNEYKEKLSELKKRLTVHRDNYFEMSQEDKLIIEMLVLDVLVYRNEKLNLPGDSSFLDCHVPILIGRNLRNYLAHGNPVAELFIPDIFKAVIANAEYLVADQSFGTFSPLRPITKREKDFHKIDVQINLQMALQQGDLESVKQLLEKKADLRSIDLDLRRSLHHAVVSADQDCLNLVLEDNQNLDYSDILGYTAWHIASELGTLRECWFCPTEDQILCIEPDNVDKTDHFCRTSLHLATLNGQLECVKTLVLIGADTTAVDGLSESALQYSIAGGFKDILQHIIEASDVILNVDTEDVYGETFLHAASKYGHTELVQYLIDEKANVNAKNCRNWRPSHYAAFNGFDEVIKILVNNGAFVNLKTIPSGWTALHLASQNGHYQTVETLVELGAFIDRADVFKAIEKGHTKIVDLLIRNIVSKRANVDKPGTSKQMENEIIADTEHNDSYILCAARLGHVDIVKVLLQSDGLFSEADILIAFHLSAKGGHLEVVKRLLEEIVKRKLDINTRNMNQGTVLHSAAESGDTEIINILLKAGADVKYLDQNNCTPLHISIKYGHSDACEVFLYAGVDVHTKDKVGLAAIHYACFYGNILVVKKLLEIESMNMEELGGDQGFTPLHIAVERGFIEIVQLLIQNKANVNVLSNNKITPLHLAVSNNRYLIVETLINTKQCELNAINDNGDSVLCCAAKYNFIGILKYLISRGADVTFNQYKPLKEAITCDKITTAKELLQHVDNIFDITYEDGNSLLHTAASNGNWIIGESILNKINKLNLEQYVNSLNNVNQTALHVAANKGHEQFVELLIKHGPDVSQEDSEGKTVLDYAVLNGNVNVVNILLCDDLKYKHKIEKALSLAESKPEIIESILNSVGDPIQTTVVELIVKCGHIDLLQRLHKTKNIDLSLKNDEGLFLVHLAAACGHEPIMEYLLDHGIYINLIDDRKRTSLHHASKSNKLNMVKYLINNDASIDCKDENGNLPIHVAAECGYLDILNCLLNKGSFYNVPNNSGDTPSILAKSNVEITKVLCDIDELFDAVKNENNINVQNLVSERVCLNARDTESLTVLHHTIILNNEECFTELLSDERIDTNVKGKSGNYPLHLAIHSYEMVMSLLRHGAKYNICNDEGETPKDLSSDSVENIMESIDQYFQRVLNHDTEIILDLNNEDNTMIQAIVRTKNVNNKSVVVLGIENNFQKIQELKNIQQDDSFQNALDWIEKREFENAYNALNLLLRMRLNIFSGDDPSVLDIYILRAQICIQLLDYATALMYLKEVRRKQIKLFNSNSRQVLSTESLIFCTLSKFRKGETILNRMKNVYEKQKHLLGEYDCDTLNTACEISELLISLDREEQALDIISNVSVQSHKLFGCKNQIAISAKLIEAKIHYILSNIGKARKLYESVYKTMKEVFDHRDPRLLKCEFYQACLFVKTFDYDKALILLKRIYYLQCKVLGSDHPDAIETENILKDTSLQRCEKKYAVHVRVSKYNPQTHGVNFALTCDRTDNHNNDELLLEAVKRKDYKTVEDMINSGSDVNAKNKHGKYPIFYAVKNDDIKMVDLLLKHGADVSDVTWSGETLLHVVNNVEMAVIIFVNLEKYNFHNLKDLFKIKKYWDDESVHEALLRRNFLSALSQVRTIDEHA